MDLSTIKEAQIIISKDGLTAIKYTVVEEKIDLVALRNEKVNLEAELLAKEPTKEELIEMGKMQHPYYMRNVESIKRRLEEITKLLG